MHTFKISYWLFVLLCLMGAQGQSFAQHFRVLDQHSREPILGLSFQYGNQQGVSDAEGHIRISVMPGEPIHLSHINYGKWALSADELKQVLDRGILYRAEVSVTLQPITVISLKQSAEKDQGIVISDQERLHHDAGAVLNLNPVVGGIRKSGAFGFDPVMRGFKYDQLNVVIDGFHAANAACPNRMDPPTSQVALNRIKQVEILKGPHALRYGIGLGGTINYIQEDPDFTSSGVYGRLSTMYESNGNVFRNEGRVGISGEGHDIGVMGSWSSGGDYQDGNGVIVPANFTRGTVGMYGDFRLGEADLIQATINRNFARDVDFPTLPMDLRTDDTWMASLRHTRTFKNKKLLRWTNSGYFTAVDHLMDNLLRDLDPRMMNARTPATTRNQGFRTEGQWKLGEGRLFAGADYRSEAARGVRQREFLMGPMAGTSLFDNAWQDAQIQKYGVFTTYTLPVGAYLLSAAARVDLNHSEARDTTPEFGDANEVAAVTQLNPGLSVGLQRDFAEHFTMGVWVAGVQRSGSILERFINYFPVGVDPFEMVGNPNLKAETNRQLDVLLGYGKGNLQVEFSPFVAFLTDYITAERTALTPRIATSPGVRQFVQVDRALKSGFELSVAHEMGAGIRQQWAMAYTRGQNMVLGEALPEIAPLDIRYTLTGTHLDDKLQSAIRLRHVAGQNRVSTQFGELPTPRFTLLDVDASYALSSQFMLKAGVQNLLNQAYYEHLNRPIGGDRRPLFSPGRNFFVMVGIKLP
ncbi:MAG: TonB-dependent receptor [Lunatimonas sp.]|uniref:TonB-dependent receptor domain-containing protein n=1 Tax=Lunatimonas sp. TaxID=2060141 RepID=UPI00263B73E3|nr:TonB-dependent receptor [Lunatimonas sp.]MCC5937937.1 TonB-dependent receptor [Lunatimonas sp.]